MNAFVHRLIAATLPVVSAAILFAGSAHAEPATQPPVSPFQQCLDKGGTPEQCAAQQNTIPSTQGGVKPSLTPIRRITNVRVNNVTASSFGAVQLIRAR